MVKRKIFRFTPLGRADSDVKRYIEDRIAEEEVERYERALEKFRTASLAHLAIKSLLYASVITSIAATIGLDQAYLLEKIASYIGLGLLLVIFAISKYFMALYKESYHVQREIVIAEASKK